MSDFLKSLYNKAYDAGSEILKPVADTYNQTQEAISAGKRKFTDALVNATNLMPQDLRKGKAYEEGQQDIKEVTGNIFDVATPDATALLPVGKLSKVLGMSKNAAKAVKIGDKTAEELAKEVRLAKFGDTLKNQERLGEAVFNKGKQEVGTIEHKLTAQDKWVDKTNADMLKSAYNRQLEKATKEANELVSSGMSKPKALEAVTLKHFQNPNLGNPKDDLIRNIFGRK